MPGRLSVSKLFGMRQEILQAQAASEHRGSKHCSATLPVVSEGT